MKNVVFDLGRVVFAQDPAKSTAEFKQFFSYVQQTPMPQLRSLQRMKIALNALP